jgi:hypothetical protein
MFSKGVFSEDKSKTVLTTTALNRLRSDEDTIDTASKKVSNEDIYNYIVANLVFNASI